MKKSTTKLKQDLPKNGSRVSPAAMENVAKFFFRQADRGRAKRLGKPFVDRYPVSK